MKISTKIPVYETIHEVKGGTILEESRTRFETYRKNTNQEQNPHYPTHYCFNGTVDIYNPKTGKFKPVPNFNYINYYCMRNFSANYKTPTDALLFMITGKTGRPEELSHFYNYLFSKESPWVGTHQSLCFIGQDKYGIPDSILWYDTSNCDAKLMANLLCTIRLHTCWGLDAIWLKFVEAGFTPEEAILLCTNFSFAGQEITAGPSPALLHKKNVCQNLKISKFGCSKTDMPFNTNYNPSGFAPLLKDKKPRVTSKSLMEKTPTQPNNYIWNADGIQINADNLTRDSEEYEKGTIKVSRGKDPYGLIQYLAIKTKKLSKEVVSEISELLNTNKLLVI